MAADQGVLGTSPAAGADSARLPLERLMAQPMAHVAAAALFLTQEQRQHLQKVHASIISELSLPAVLHRIVEAACEVLGARNASLGVIGGATDVLDDILYAGIDAGTATAVSDLATEPEVIDLLAGPNPICFADDLTAVGLPPEIPRHTTILTIPVPSRDTVIGTLYVTDRLDGAEFTREDEQLLLELGATAGMGIENARLYGVSRRRQEWLRASGEISRQLLGSSFDEVEVLHQIALSVKRLAVAQVVTVVLPLDAALGEMLVVAATGLGEQELRGLHYQRKDAIAWQAMVEGRGLRFDDVDKQSEIYLHLRSVAAVTHVMALPLTGEAGSRGAIMVGRTKQVPFTDSDLEMAETFAGQAALALELADARAVYQRLTELENRDRIARDLHDNVIQRLFSAGLSVQASASSVPEGPVRARLARTVDDLDDTIRSIRTSIFALQDPRSEQSLRKAALTVVNQVSPLFAVRPNLQFAGSLDSIYDEGIVADTEAVLRESLTNIAKHAHARDIHITLRATGIELVITVSDDGVGLGDATRRSGLANLRARAEHYGGRLDLHDNPEGGLRLRWSIPLPT